MKRADGRSRGLLIALLGGFAFLLSRAYTAAPEVDAKIVITRVEIDKTLKEMKATRASTTEAEAIEWLIHDEILFREGLKRKMHLHQLGVRERLLKLMDSVTVPPERTPTDAELKAFFQARWQGEMPPERELAREVVDAWAREQRAHYRRQVIDRLASKYKVRIDATAGPP